jgi:preprotein translocase subunit SecF
MTDMSHMQLLKELNIDFMGKRRIAAIVSGVVLLICLLSIIFRGFNFGLDFTGGTVIEVGYEEPTEIAEVTGALAEGGFEGATVQYFGSRQDILIRLGPDAVSVSVTSAISTGSSKPSSMTVPPVKSRPKSKPRNRMEPRQISSATPESKAAMYRLPMKSMLSSLRI